MARVYPLGGIPTLIPYLVVWSCSTSAGRHRHHILTTRDSRAFTHVRVCIPPRKLGCPCLRAREHPFTFRRSCKLVRCHGATTDLSAEVLPGPLAVGLGVAPVPAYDGVVVSSRARIGCHKLGIRGTLPRLQGHRAVEVVEELQVLLLRHLGTVDAEGAHVDHRWAAALGTLAGGSSRPRIRGLTATSTHSPSTRARIRTVEAAAAAVAIAPDPPVGAASLTPVAGTGPYTSASRARFTGSGEVVARLTSTAASDQRKLQREPKGRAQRAVADRAAHGPPPLPTWSAQHLKVAPWDVGGS